MLGLATAVLRWKIGTYPRFKDFQPPRPRTSKPKKCFATRHELLLSTMKRSRPFDSIVISLLCFAPALEWRGEADRLVRNVSAEDIQVVAVIKPVHPSFSPLQGGGRQFSPLGDRRRESSNPRSLAAAFAPPFPTLGGFRPLLKHPSNID